VAFLTGYVGSAEVHARIDRAIADGACGCRPKPDFRRHQEPAGSPHLCSLTG
jgi:hypothetical protein